MSHLTFVALGQLQASIRCIYAAPFIGCPQVWMRELVSQCHSVHHSGDARSGHGTEGEDETITVHLPKVPARVRCVPQGASVCICAHVCTRGSVLLRANSSHGLYVCLIVIHGRYLAVFVNVFSAPSFSHVRNCTVKMYHGCVSAQCSAHCHRCTDSSLCSPFWNGQSRCAWSQSQCALAVAVASKVGCVLMGRVFRPLPLDQVQEPQVPARHPHGVPHVSRLGVRLCQGHAHVCAGPTGGVLDGPRDWGTVQARALLLDAKQHVMYSRWGGVCVCNGWVREWGLITRKLLCRSLF